MPKKLNSFDLVTKLFKYDWARRCARMIGRAIILHDLGKPESNYFSGLVLRSDITAIGMSGHVSDLDRAVASNRNLAPLSPIEVWFLLPIIMEGKLRNWEAWRRNTITTTGEDPGPYSSEHPLTDANWEAHAEQMREHLNRKPTFMWKVEKT